MICLVLTSVVCYSFNFVCVVFSQLISFVYLSFPLFPPTATKLGGCGFSFSFLKEPSFGFNFEFYYFGLSNLLIIAFIFSSKSFCFSVVYCYLSNFESEAYFIYFSFLTVGNVLFLSHCSQDFCLCL